MLKRTKPKYPTSAQLKERTQWGQQFDRCWKCGSSFSLQTHEIASRAQAPYCWAHVSNYARVCNRCHADFAAMSFERQLIYKAAFDPETFSPITFLAIRGNAITEVTWNDLVLEAASMLRERIEAERRPYRDRLSEARDEI
jgi:hypothetical protein